MEETSPSTSQASAPSSMTTIADLNEDSLAHCASYLNLQDVSNLAMSCKSLKHVAYSDRVWKSLSWEQWPQEFVYSLLEMSGVRETYLARRTALLQFKFVDPLVSYFYSAAKPYDNLQMDKNDIFFSQGSLIHNIKIDSYLSGRDSLFTMSDHNARITCIRLFQLTETSLFRSEAQRIGNVLVTSGCDHLIHLWWKGSCQ